MVIMVRVYAKIYHRRHDLEAKLLERRDIFGDTGSSEDWGPLHRHAAGHVGHMLGAS